jgi:hypothetical protein
MSEELFVRKLFSESHKGFTEKGAETHTRTGSSLVDFFAQGAAMRDNNKMALDLFKKAFSEDREKAIRILFYIRDVRGGQGEREIFRRCLNWLAGFHGDVLDEIVFHVPIYGRWDDMFIDRKVCLEIIKQQLKRDSVSNNPSLLAKWLPTINSKNRDTKHKAFVIAKKIGMSDKEYRITVRDIRKKIRIVEALMSSNKWEEIEYDRVPSQAAKIYKNAFNKHDEERYSRFIERVKEGTEKINAATLFPYQIYDSVQKDYSQTLEALWMNLPDYTTGKNAIVVADVSGSMFSNSGGRPMSVSVSLALYFAERNKGKFQNCFITFSSKPQLQRVQGRTLMERMNSIESANWSMNTDLEAVFELILGTAVLNRIPVKDLPSTIYIISDMEFDSCTGSNNNLTEIKEKYKLSGYPIPNIVFWNVHARNKNVPAEKDEEGVTLVSGCSPSIFRMAVENKTPEQLMLDIVNSDRYKDIVL